MFVFVCVTRPLQQLLLLSVVAPSLAALLLPLTQPPLLSIAALWLIALLLRSVLLPPTVRLLPSSPRVLVLLSSTAAP